MKRAFLFVSNTRFNINSSDTRVFPALVGAEIKFKKKKTQNETIIIIIITAIQIIIEKIFPTDMPVAPPYPRPTLETLRS